MSDTKVAELEKQIAQLTIKIEEIEKNYESKFGPVLETLMLPNARQIAAVDGKGDIGFRTALRHISDIFMIRSGQFTPGTTYAIWCAEQDLRASCNVVVCIERGVLQFPFKCLVNCKYIKIVQLLEYRAHDLDKRDGTEITGVRFIGMN